ncbi:MAG: DUF3891 family protein [Bacteroidota bacterium]
MIVNYTESGWQIITQRSHGLLAAQICAHWKRDNQPGRWVDTLIATAEHDDVYNELENEDILNKNGGPVNFKQTAFNHTHAQRLMDLAETKSSYIALLTARHIQFVHGEDVKAKSFISKLKKQEKNWIQVSGSSSEEVGRGYELLEFCDAFSLLICQGLIQPEHRKIEISEGPDGKAYEMHASGEGIVVHPWPFDEDSFLVSWESRTISKLSFANVAEFRAAFSGTSAVSHQLKLIRKG